MSEIDELRAARYELGREIGDFHKTLAAALPSVQSEAEAEELAGQLADKERRHRELGDRIKRLEEQEGRR